jgi:hypothetical protein
MGKRRYMSTSWTDDSYKGLYTSITTSVQKLTLLDKIKLWFKK